MPVEVVPRVTNSVEDAGVSRLSSFGFSGTIAHGAFGIPKPTSDYLVKPSEIALYRAQ